MQWPPLDSVSFVSGRVATEADGVDGSAVFVLEGSDDKHGPIATDVPQYGLFQDQGCDSVRCILKQAEKTSDDDFYGIWLFETDEYFVASSSSVILLGRDPPRRNQNDPRTSG